MFTEIKSTAKCYNLGCNPGWSELPKGNWLFFSSSPKGKPNICLLDILHSNLQYFCKTTFY